MLGTGSHGPTQPSQNSTITQLWESRLGEVKGQLQGHKDSGQVYLKANLGSFREMGVGCVGSRKGKLQPSLAQPSHCLSRAATGVSRPAGHEGGSLCQQSQLEDVGYHLPSFRLPFLDTSFFRGFSG